MLWACSHQAPPPFDVHRAAAERAYAHGRYREAAAAWARAEAIAPSNADREEARYRQAVSLARAGDASAAESLYTELARSPGGRQERAAYALVEREVEAGGSHAERALLDFVRRFPDGALTPRALRRYLTHIEHERGARQALAAAVALTPELDRSATAEQLQYSVAELLERDGQLSAARDRYLATAARFPYPRGSYWDDSLFRAAELEERLGRPAAAIAHLERMLAERESALFVGSYERPRYDDAQLRIAELYRDRLGDPARARRAFATLWEEFPTSRLRDDAAWSAALLAKQAGDQAESCEWLRELRRATPDSRYAACAALLCPQLQGGSGRCRAAIRRSVTDASANARSPER